MALGDFSAQAAAYARTRPGYPAALLDELVELAGAGPGDPVADLGAGTGILARALAERGLAVTAVEPNGAMRAGAQPDPRVRWIAGRFEASGLAAGSQAWAVAAQSFHWARPAEALPELARILRPGACFTALWNDRETERSALLIEVRAILEREAPGYEGHRAADWSGVLTSTGDFVEVVVSSARHVVEMVPERFVALWRSVNRLAELAGSEGLERVVEAIERAVEADGSDPIEVPYLCRAYTARRS